MKMIYYLRFWSNNSQKVIIKLEELKYLKKIDRGKISKFLN